MACPLTIENCGRTLRFDKPPTRIVTSFQTAAEAIIALGAAEKLVGLYFGQVHDLPPDMTEAFKRIPTLGERGYPSSEVVLNARPDLFVAYDLEGDVGGERANVREALEQANVHIFGMNCAAAPVTTTASYYLLRTPRRSWSCAWTRD